METATFEPREMTFDETIAHFYDDEWVLMKITAFGEHMEPLRGIVLAHSPKRGDISIALRQEPARSELPADAPYQPYYTFKAFPRTHIGESYEEASARFAAQRAAVLDAQRA